MSAMFAALVGESFETLPATLRRLHCAGGVQRYLGVAEIERGRGLLARLFALAARLPPVDGQVPLQVEIAVTPTAETWTRHFGPHPMRSRLTAADGLLRERLGAATFFFKLGAEDGRLTWRVVRVRALGLPLPATWFSAVRATEFEQAGRYHFDVEARLPVVGLLIHYQGSLDDV